MEDERRSIFMFSLRCKLVEMATQEILEAEKTREEGEEKARFGELTIS